MPEQARCLSLRRFHTFITNMRQDGKIGSDKRTNLFYPKQQKRRSSIFYQLNLRRFVRRSHFPDWVSHFFVTEFFLFQFQQRLLLLFSCFLSCHQNKILQEWKWNFFILHHRHQKMTFLSVQLVEGGNLARFTEYSTHFFHWKSCWNILHASNTWKVTFTYLIHK